MPINDRVDIIIPTYNNFDQLLQCVGSMVRHRLIQPVRIIIVNNGEVKMDNAFGGMDGLVTVINTGENLGWTGGLRKGLEISDSKYVCFANDDIYIPVSSGHWLQHLVRELDAFPETGAVGPTSNVVMGAQNIWCDVSHLTTFTNLLIGFCMLVRREALDKVGGVQDMEFGGDDLDLSIRLRKAGYYLAVKRTVFVYHHGFQTGEQVYGKPSQPNGWNSREMIDNVTMELIRKHGFMEWWKMMTQTADAPADVLTVPDEADIVKPFIKGDVIVEVGCGHNKTVESAIGVDRIPKGEEIPCMDAKSVADVVSDAGVLPFGNDYADTIIARQVLEHCVDPLQAMKEWKRVLKPGGRMIISFPDEDVCYGVPLNAEHLHAFTCDSMGNLADALELSEVGRTEKYNRYSSTMCFRKDGNNGG